jgi:3D (Asp-Asp-Asp) domain-containing protein
MIRIWWNTLARLSLLLILVAAVLIIYPPQIANVQEVQYHRVYVEHEVRPPALSRSLRFREMTVTATAYCDEGITYSGLPSGIGAIAVDPKIIPLGSAVWVEGYGYSIALDTGGLIHGAKIDVFLPDREACLRWGVRKVKIRVFEQLAERSDG